MTLARGLGASVGTEIHYEQLQCPHLLYLAEQLACAPCCGIHQHSVPSLDRICHCAKCNCRHPLDHAWKKHRCVSHQSVSIGEHWFLGTLLTCPSQVHLSACAGMHLSGTDRCPQAYTTSIRSRIIVPLLTSNHLHRPSQLSCPLGF